MIRSKNKISLNDANHWRKRSVLQSRTLVIFISFNRIYMFFSRNQVIELGGVCLGSTGLIIFLCLLNDHDNISFYFIFYENIKIIVMQ